MKNAPGLGVDQPGSVFWLEYAPGSVPDLIVEHSAGPDDWLRNLTGSYTPLGNSKYLTALADYAAFYDPIRSETNRIRKRLFMDGDALRVLRDRATNVFGLLLAGCSATSPTNVVTPYPESWPDPDVSLAGSCQTIVGTFENAGESSAPQAHGLTLAETFLSVSHSAGIANSVYLRIDEDETEIVLRKSGEREDVELSDNYLRGLECTNGWFSHMIELDGYHEGSFSKGYTNTLFATAGDYLVIRSRSDLSSGSLPVKTTRYDSDTYTRFRRVHPTDDGDSR